MPQWVTSSGPDALKDVPGMRADAFSTTVPDSLPMSSLMFMLKRDGTGGSILSGRESSMEPWRKAEKLPVVTMTLFACTFLPLANVSSKVSSCLSMWTTLWFECMLMPVLEHMERNILIISCASWDAGNTQWSLCTVSATPWASNHLYASLWLNVFSRRFISFAPRG